MTAVPEAAEPWAGSTQSLIAEIVDTIAADGKLFNGVVSLRRIRAAGLLNGMTPGYAATQAERYSRGVEEVALVVGWSLAEKTGEPL